MRDVDRMLQEGMIEPQKLLRLFESVEPELYRYPAIDPPSFRHAVEEILKRLGRS